MLPETPWAIVICLATAGAVYFVVRREAAGTEATLRNQLQEALVRVARLKGEVELLQKQRTWVLESGGRLQEEKEQQIQDLLNRLLRAKEERDLATKSISELVANHHQRELSLLAGFKVLDVTTTPYVRIRRRSTALFRKYRKEVGFKQELSVNGVPTGFTRFNETRDIDAIKVNIEKMLFLAAAALDGGSSSLLASFRENAENLSRDEPYVELQESPVSTDDDRSEE